MNTECDCAVTTKEEMECEPGVNIRKRKDGRYEARYPKGRDAAGKLLYGYCIRGTPLKRRGKNRTGSWRSAPGR